MNYDNWKLQTPPANNEFKNPCNCVFCAEEMETEYSTDHLKENDEVVYLCFLCESETAALENEELNLMIELQEIQDKSN